MSCRVGNNAKEVDSCAPSSHSPSSILDVPRNNSVRKHNGTRITVRTKRDVEQGWLEWMLCGRRPRGKALESAQDSIDEYTASVRIFTASAHTSAAFEVRCIVNRTRAFVAGLLGICAQWTCTARKCASGGWHVVRRDTFFHPVDNGRKRIEFIQRRPPLQCVMPGTRNSLAKDRV